MPILRRLAALTLLVVTGCVSPISPSPTLVARTATPTATSIPLVPASLEPETVRLPTNGAPRGGGCLGVGFDAVLRGSPQDPRVAWLEDRTEGLRIDVVFPLGFVARFTPQLEVLDENGRVVARDGDGIDGGCGVALGPWTILSDLPAPQST
jgi:hypothetical protein